MTQEEFGAYWGHAEEIVKEKRGAYDLVALRMPAPLVSEREGFAACLVGRAGGFAGTFLLYGRPPMLGLRGRWFSPSGTWYSFRQTLSQDQGIDDLISFARRVIDQEDACSVSG